VLTVCYWLAASWLLSRLGHYRAANVGFLIGVVVWGAGHALANRGVHRHTRRATAVIGVMLVALGVLSLATSRAPFVDLVLGLVTFAVFDVVGEILFWRYALTGAAKSLIQIRRRAVHRGTTGGGSWA
jgi:hypothetical protein